MITQAAIRKDGKIYTGRRHAEILFKAEKYGLGWAGLKGAEQGFVDESGRFYTRKQAGIVAWKCGQMPRVKKHLLSEDLW